MDAKTKKKYLAVDLFAGAGGTSSGLMEAVKALGIKMWLAAVNHDPIALATHALNHPEAIHIDSDLEKVNPLDVVPGGFLDLLVASPECTFFSRARGGKPKNWQSRATVKWVLKWMTVLNVLDVLIENVPEFVDWGPLHRKCVCGLGEDETVIHPKPCLYGQPIQEKKGIFFRQFITEVKALGYNVEYRTVVCADYGDPTTRERLFIICRKGLPVTYPAFTHSKNGATMMGRSKKWKTAKDVLNLKNKGADIREKKLSPNTLRRIAKGLERQGLETFILSGQSGGGARAVNRPLPTLTAQGTFHVIQPFLIKADNGGAVMSANNPVPTLTSADSIAVIQPYLIQYNGTSDDVPISRPVPTLTSKERFALVTPMVEHAGGMYELKIYHRMITIEEMKLVHSFKKDYKFHGTRKQVSKQIGMSVPTKTAQALTQHILETRG